MTGQFELTLLNRRAEVARAQDALEAFAASHSVAQTPLHALQLALEEHLTNILNHAYQDDLEHRILVRLRFQGSELRIDIEDDGSPFNPLNHPAPDLSQPFEERPIGGLGIHMMRKSVDEIEYRREGDKNVLTMVKTL